MKNQNKFQPKCQPRRWWSIRPLITSQKGHELSLSKITMIIGVAFSCYIMHKLTNDGRMTAEYFMIFVGATFGTNSLNKAISVFGEREQRRYDNNYQYKEETDDIVENIK